MNLEPGFNLQRRLDEITARTRALVPPDRLARTEQVVAELRATNIEERIPRPGSPVEAFTLLGANGRKVRSADLLALGPLVVTFFRGRWCPYDMTELETWQALYPRLRECGALLVAISPQTPRQNAFTAEQHHLQFPMLSDPRAEMAASLELAYTVPEETRPWYRSMLVNIPLMNGDESWRLPLPATCILVASAAQEGLPGAAKVRFAAGFADHRMRPEPEGVLSELEKIRPR